MVDDNSTNRLVLAKSLEKAGYEVLTANDGFEGVEAATRQQPDLVLLDMMMPGRNGIETCTILKAQKETSTIPVVFVTAVSETDQILKAFAAGGCDYVTKPFRSDEVLARVSAHVGLRRAEAELRQQNKQLAELTNELSVLSRVESLTGLLNRRTWEETIEQEHERFQRHGSPYSVVMIDVDCFKAFNDVHGHQAGDECLRRIAGAIASVCRRVDSVGRYGGEEFVVLTPETRGESAVKLAERIRSATWALGIPHPTNMNVGRVTISLGVATCACGSWEDVLKKADDALYVAKKAGRNMVYAADDTLAGTSPQAAADGSTASPTPATPKGHQQVRVLIVDDERTNRVICKGCLERAGYRVREAVDGHTAITSVREDPPDVIIMDVMMPNMDGLECTRRLKADPDTRDIPIITVSALGEGEDILAGLEAGADEYLTKPIRTTELALRVRTMARQYRDRVDLLRSFQLRGEHMQILTRLVEFCREIATSKRLDEVLEHTISAVADIVHSRRVSVMLPDDEQQRLRIVKSTGMDAELASTVKVPVGEPIAGQVFTSGRPVVINSEAEKPANRGTYDSRFFASVPLICTPLGAAGKVIGVLNVTERIGGQPFEPNELEYIELIAKVVATAMQEILSREAHVQASDSIMVALAKLAEHRDSDTGLHLDRVTRYCCILAEELRGQDEYRHQIDEAFMRNLVRSVPLHDIGKVAIPDEILRYPGKLNAKQMEVMRTHAVIGANTIDALIARSPRVDFLKMAADVARYHHEWYDGSGYPHGLKAHAIPLSARISALADVYDALTTKRVYKEAAGHSEAVTIIAGLSGTQFDPVVVQAFCNHEGDFARLAAELADESCPAGRQDPKSPVRQDLQPVG
ncbi:MAG: response regulator [Planctomycetes bacterium]|nr:response regulator [Planctomycetota bacterium]